MHFVMFFKSKKKLRYFTTHNNLSQKCSRACVWKVEKYPQANKSKCHQSFGQIELLNLRNIKPFDQNVRAALLLNISLE